REVPPPQPRSPGPTPGPTHSIWLKSDGRAVPGQFLQLAPIPPAPGTPRRGGNRIRLAGQEQPPEAQSTMMLARYSLATVTGYRKENSERERTWQECASVQIPAGQQSFEVRIDRENVWSIQLPPELLKQCTAATQPG